MSRSIKNKLHRGDKFRPCTHRVGRRGAPKKRQHRSTRTAPHDTRSRHPVPGFGDIDHPLQGPRVISGSNATPLGPNSRWMANDNSGIARPRIDASGNTFQRIRGRGAVLPPTGPRAMRDVFRPRPIGADGRRLRRRANPSGPHSPASSQPGRQRADASPIDFWGRHSTMPIPFQNSQFQQVKPVDDNFRDSETRGNYLQPDQNMREMGSTAPLIAPVDPPRGLGRDDEGSTACDLVIRPKVSSLAVFNPSDPFGVRGTRQHLAPALPEVIQEGKKNMAQVPKAPLQIDVSKLVATWEEGSRPRPSSPKPRPQENQAGPRKDTFRWQDPATFDTSGDIVEQLKKIREVRGVRGSLPDNVIQALTVKVNSAKFMEARKTTDKWRVRWSTEFDDILWYLLDQRGTDIGIISRCFASRPDAVLSRAHILKVYHGTIPTGWSADDDARLRDLKANQVIIANIASIMDRNVHDIKLRLRIHLMRGEEIIYNPNDQDDEERQAMLDGDEHEDEDES